MNSFKASPFIIKWDYKYRYLCLKTRDKAISKALNAVLKVRGISSAPVGAVCTWNCLLAHETNVQNVLGIVAVITSKAIVGEAEVAHGNG